MIAFEIKLNEQSLGTAGADDLSVLTAIVSAVGKLGPASQWPGQPEVDDRIELRVGGLTSRSDAGSDEHLDWIEQTLQPGDVVTISVLDATTADVATAAKPARTDDDYKRQYEWAKNFYLENRDKFDDG